jgi:hypothetical protein
MAANTYRLTISYNTAGQFAQNVLHYRFSDDGFATTVQAADALNNAFNTHCVGPLKDALSLHTQILSLKSRRILAAGGFEAVKLGVAGDIGNRTGDLSASGLAPLIRFITNNVPVITGRMFLPGLSDDDGLDGYISPALATDLQDLANALDDPLTLTGGGSPVATPVVVSRSPVVASIPVQVCVPCSFLATQRRRQRPV